MKRQIDHGRRDELHRRKALIIGARIQQPLDQISGHRLPSLPMPRMLLQHLRHLQPMLVKLAGQFNEIARNRGAADETIGHIRQHLMQGMAEFMEQGARIVIRQQRRIALGKIADIHHDRPLIAAQFPLRPHRRTPGTRAF